LPVKSKSILFVLEGFFPFQKAGTEVYVLQLANYLIARGESVQILISTSQHRQEYSYEDIPVHTFDIPEKPIAEELNGLIPPRGMESFLEKVKAINPGIVHFHSLGRAINSFHIAEVKKLGYKTVFTAHLGSNICVKGDFLKFNKEICDGKVVPTICLACSLHSRGVGSSIAKLSSVAVHFAIRLNNRLLPSSFHQALHRKQELERVKKNTDAIVAIAPWIYNVLHVNGIDERVHLVEQAVDKLFLERKATNSKNSSVSSIRLGFVGRMHPHKGFHLLRDALHSTKDSSWELKIATIPSKNENEYYLEMFKWASIHKQIEWTENQTRENIIGLLDNIDLLILPSVSNEMAPLVILEAHARQVPVLGSSYPAIADMIKDGHDGRLFKNGSVADLSMKLREIFHQPQILQQWSANIRIPRTFDDVGKDMLSIYDGII
jgi:glycosyltransferase involved in cell wall biosynthesis